MSLTIKGAGIKNRLSNWFVDREFFMRANGQVHFLRISAKLQRRFATLIATIIGLWLVVTLGMAVNQFSVSIERMALVRKEAKVQTAQERVAAYRNSIEDVTKELEQRQTIIESLSEQHLGITPGLPQTNTGEASNDSEADDIVRKIGAAVPEAAGLAHIEARQIRFVEHLTSVANIRAERAEAAIRQFGLNPQAMARRAQSGLGGPYIPFFGKPDGSVTDPRFTRLASALELMDSMERALAGIPTSKPAAILSMSSGFGYRRDPFNRSAAMHSGVDFKGPVGTAILAAADGRITYAARRPGYGKCMEITHANGLVTRYAHLSSFTMKLGDRVKRGTQIAHMGSTGRSTGSHLHFEVRLNGTAINPRKFLEANPDVLKIQAGANRADKQS